MKKGLIVWIVLLLGLGAWGQADNSNELETARQWLAKKGLADSDLYVEYENGSLVVFCNRRTDAFCIVARADVWKYLRSPVLAYSVDGLLRGVNETSKKVLLEGYEKQIEALRQTCDTIPTAKPRHGAVAPLLGSLRWGQHHPYNIHSPHIGDQRILIGCVPLSIAMVMMCHKWPQQGTSDVFIHPQNAKVFNYRFDKFHPRWSEYKDRYSSRDTIEIEGLARVLSTISLCTDPGIKAESVSKNVHEIKHLFVNNLKYSGRMAAVNFEKAPASEVDSLLRCELDGSRPCIISSGNHAFVCDGYDGDYFHYNLGWHGKGNGYYLLDAGRHDTATNVVRGLVYGMEPQRNEIVKEVHLAKANTLRTLLSEQEQQCLTSLKLSGPIGSDDVRLLRQMAGAADKDGYPRYPWGALQKLDLSAAVIKKDKNAYLSRKATGSRWRTRTMNDGIHDYTEKKTFEFSKMDEKSWREFKSVIGITFEGYTYSYADGCCWENYNLRANTIGMYMFANCTSLNEIVLPEKISGIDFNAFMNCQSLQVMRIPKKTKWLGRNPFCRCTSLAELWLPKGIQFNGDINSDCSPGFKAHAYEE